MGTYFRADTTRMSFRELWRLSRSMPLFLTACFNKVFRIRPPVVWAVLHDDAIYVLPADQVPVHAMRMLEPLVEDFQRLGARLAFYQTVPSTENMEGYSAVLLPPEQNAVIVIAWSRAQLSGRSREGTLVRGIISRLQDDTFLSTTNRRTPFDRPPEFRALLWRRANPEELCRRHQEALAESPFQAMPVRHEEDAKKVLLEAKRRRFEWNVSRGVYVPLTTEELDRLGLPVGGNCVSVI